MKLWYVDPAAKKSRGDKTELNPWDYLSEEDLKKFLVDPTNNENALDRKLAIDYIWQLRPVAQAFLDVGSGTGNMYLALKNSMLELDYLGIDKTQKMVEFAQMRFPEAKFVQGNIHSLPFQDRSWDIVYSRHVIEHLPGYEKALTELARVCSSCLIICLCKPLADRQEIKVIGKPPAQTKKGSFSEHYLNTYKKELFIGTLKNLGFDIVVDRLIKVGGYFGNYELIIARRGGRE